MVLVCYKLQSYTIPMTSILNGFKVDVAHRSKTAMAGACYWFAMHYGCQSYPLPWLKNKKVDQGYIFFETHPHPPGKRKNANGQEIGKGRN